MENEKVVIYTLVEPGNFTEQPSCEDMSVISDFIEEIEIPEGQDEIQLTVIKKRISKKEFAEMPEG